ncbi:MAG: hypothetical protein PHX65_07220 [Sulfurimonas sp.]|nr:hypothetical protein [Sulfurimonas sp.]
MEILKQGMEKMLNENDNFFAAGNTDDDGFILFNDKQLNGKKTKLDANTYKDANFTYSLDGNNLIVVDKNLGEYITIENFKDGAMGINLDKEEENANRDILVKISDPTVVEGNEGVSYMSFTIESSRPLTENESVTLKLSTEEFTATNDDYGSLSTNTITLNASNSSQTVTLEILGDTEATQSLILQKYTTIITNTKNQKTSSTCQEYFASIKKHFCTITC